MIYTAGLVVPPALPCLLRHFITSLFHLILPQIVLRFVVSGEFEPLSAITHSICSSQLFTALGSDLLGLEGQYYYVVMGLNNTELCNLTDRIELGSLNSQESIGNHDIALESGAPSQNHSHEPS